MSAYYQNLKQDEPQDVRVKLVSFYELASRKQPLMLDSYQRAYVWTEEKVTQLLRDFTDFISAQSPDSLSQYYLGTLLLHEKEHQGKKGYCVIDGQQRLTTLAVLYWSLTETLPDFIEFEFRSSHSLVNVQNAKNTLQQWLQQHQNLRDAILSVFAQLRFTVITVTQEDLAFTFFDTQNNRGVPLGSTDLLKAFHLRAIQSDDPGQVEQLQSHCARKWEQVQQQGELVKHSKRYDFAPDLFHYYLWRGRNWRGSDVKELESRKEMLNHFADHSQVAAIGQVALYPAGTNQWGQTLELTAANDYRLTPAIQQFGQQAALLPFSLRQPISRGVGFFLYAEKYAALLQQLLFSPSYDPEIRATQHFYQSVVSTLSGYLQSLFRLALLTYYDRLGSKDLLKFSLYLDHRLGSLRLHQADIRRETPLKFLRDTKRNLLDVIASAYEGEEVIRFLHEGSDKTAYAKYEGWKEIINQSYGVQARYASAVARYYSLTDLSLKTVQCMDEKAHTALSHFKSEHNGYLSNEASHG